LISGLLDKTLDWTVLPGYSKLGFAVRERLWDDTEPNAVPAGWSVLVTGAGAGIGASACERFAHLGATVHMLVRDREKGESARARIAERTGSERLRIEVCDVSSLASVREFSSRFVSEQGELHALVNNAGVMPPERTHTEEGFELTFATNVLGPFLLTNLLRPALRRAAPSRVINVSSGGMYTQRLCAEDLQLERRGYDPPEFYAHTKRCEGDPHRALGGASARNRDRRPRDASGLGGHARRADLTAALSEADEPGASQRRPGGRHDRLARDRGRARRSPGSVLARSRAQAHPPGAVDARVRGRP
jgi:hypothetical protein